jgi:hypothetical protein
MKKFFRITNGFDRLSDIALLSRSRFIRSSTYNNNPNFTTPTPTAAEMDEVIEAFDAAIQKALSGNKQDGIYRDQLRDLLIEKLHLLGNFILFASGNDAAKAQSSGYHISKPREPKAPITTPENPVVTNGANPGELGMKCNKVAGASAYMWEYTEGTITESSVWNSQTTTASKHVFTGLKRGVTYNCRVAAIGPRQQKMYSEVVSRIAQ